MAEAKIFEVGDVLPATTQLRISWQNISMEVEENVNYVSSNSGTTSVLLGKYYWGGVPAPDGEGYLELYNSPVTSWEYGVVSAGSTIINTTAKSISDRTISYVNPSYATLFTWEDLNASSGYSITFEENGGSTVTDLTEQTALPSPLPTTTKSNHVFAGWYYDTLFTQKAVAGATIESNVTLYAKWYTPTSWCEDIADAIREKDGTTEPIKHLDFPDKIKNIQGAKPEETKTVTPNFSSGNVVVTPASGKVMTQVTVNKDTTNHIPENIKKDVTLYGVTGTLESGGGASGGYTVTIINNYGWALSNVKIIQANDSDFTVTNTSSGVFKNVTYIKIPIIPSNRFDFSGITYSELVDGKTLENDITIQAISGGSD